MAAVAQLLPVGLPVEELILRVSQLHIGSSLSSVASPRQLGRSTLPTTHYSLSSMAQVTSFTTCMSP
ncbi:unnamed protein product [Fusarium graminearum]|uniref:Chromosome 3, complete genome n=2 Tax=Gibberella zeae TaxID=5518 RepID=A0A0E0SP15_GIBZE|nr:hypothetical protein FG05_35034 [Fusarium graminearum]CAF3487198.1 unnamed protein product [Fusarium graminearum]CAF3549718.1 unnamed protein product [Fusarium graminearum]CAG2008267.1 unnamed protein product [Fusarium graminearum]CEF88178.1 unnamed protein product [Fusarium graminearum]